MQITHHQNTTYLTGSKCNKRNLALAISMIAMFGLTACQSTPTAPVMQRANATYDTIGLGKTKVQAQQNALANAKQTCGYRQPIILKDTVQYNGVFNEKTGRVVEQVGSVVGSIFGSKTPDLARDDDYEYSINFRCQ